MKTPFASALFRHTVKAALLVCVVSFTLAADKARPAAYAPQNMSREAYFELIERKIPAIRERFKEIQHPLDTSDGRKLEIAERNKILDSIMDWAVGAWELQRDNPQEGEEPIRVIKSKRAAWKHKLEVNLDALRSLGMTEGEALISLYSSQAEELYRHEKTTIIAAKTQLMVQGRYQQKTQDYAPGNYSLISSIALAGRSIVLIGDTAYDRHSGLELWNMDNFNGMLALPFGNTILATHVSGDSGQDVELRLLNGLTGEVLFTSPKLPESIVDLEPGASTIYVSDGEQLYGFDLARPADPLFKVPPAKQPARWEYLIGANSYDMYTMPDASSAALHKVARKLGMVPQNPSPSGQFTLLLPATYKAGKTSTPLHVFNAKTGKASPLVLHTGQGETPLTIERAFTDPNAIINGESRAERANNSIFYSPIGSIMAVQDVDQALHFFALSDTVQHVGSLAGEARIGSYKIPELVLAAILDDENPENPLLLFRPKASADMALVAEVYFAEKTRIDLSRIVFNKKNAPVSVAVSSKDRAVVLTESGTAFHINLENGSTELIPESTKARISAVAFSGDGTVLALADRDGNLYVSRNEEVFSVYKTGSSNLYMLALDGPGQRIWFAGTSGIIDEAGQSISSSSLGLLMPQEQRVVLHEAALDGVNNLSFSPERDRAVVIYNRDREQEPEATGLDALMRPHFQITPWEEGQISLLGWKGWDAQGFVVTPGASYMAFKRDGIIETDAEISLRAFNTYLYSAKKKQSVRLVNNTRVEFGYQIFDDTSGAIAISADGKILASTATDDDVGGTRLVLFSTESGNQLLQTPVDTRGMYPINSAAFLHKAPHRLLTASRDGVRLWDLKQNPLEPTTVLQWVFLNNGNHLVLDKDSRFDTPNIDKLDGVHWTAASVPGKALPLECFMRDYYQPRLAEYILAGRHLPPVTGIGEKNLYQAKVAVRKVMPEPGMPNHVSVVVEVDSAKDGTPQEVRDLKLFRDGVLVAWNKGAAGDGRLELKDGKAFVIFDKIALPGRKSAVTFTAYAFNEDKVRSNTGRLYHRYTPEDKGISRLHLVAVGINAFTNPDWNLRFAANDAKAFSETLPRYLELGEKADIRLLAARAESANATRERIERELARLCGQDSGLLSRDEAAISGPDDVVVITVSTHGITEKDTFYIFPSDIPGTGRAITPDLLGKAISAEQLSEWMTPL
ncbi:hypothetical protein LJC46_08845, partial [Desulfovibrio sp. OttesenSCG-928-G15]|nr:hypothetical protein [Desulfovibrio sp. OttesenSCG-928-G15]